MSHIPACGGLGIASFCNGIVGRLITGPLLETVIVRWSLSFTKLEKKTSVISA